MQAEIQYVPRFYLKQRVVTLLQRFEVLECLPDGTVGDVICLAQQKPLALKEEVSFFSDQARTQRVFSFKARNITEVNGQYDILDDAGRQLAYFNKDWQASIFRSTFHVEGPGYVGTGRERSEVAAILRRFIELPFVPIHFDYTDANGNLLLQIERQMSVRDKYTVNVPDQRIDFRVAAALAVGMDVLMHR